MKNSPSERNLGRRLFGDEPASSRPNRVRKQTPKGAAYAKSSKVTNVRTAASRRKAKLRATVATPFASDLHSAYDPGFQTSSVLLSGLFDSPVKHDGFIAASNAGWSVPVTLRTLNNEDSPSGSDVAPEWKSGFFAMCGTTPKKPGKQPAQDGKENQADAKWYHGMGGY